MSAPAPVGKVGEIVSGHFSVARQLRHGHTASRLHNVPTISVNEIAIGKCILEVGVNRNCRITQILEAFILVLLARLTQRYILCGFRIDRTYGAQKVILARVGAT